jgi:hypothetical protein
VTELLHSQNILYQKVSTKAYIIIVCNDGGKHTDSSSVTLREELVLFLQLTELIPSFAKVEVLLKQMRNF